MNEKIGSIIETVSRSDWVREVFFQLIDDENLFIHCKLMPNFDYQSSASIAREKE